MIQFTEHNHNYESLIPDGIEWLSVTGFIHSLCEPFDNIEKAAKCSVRKPGKYPNKWYKVPPAEILTAWEGESNRSTELGHWYHSKREHALYNDTDIIVHKPVYSNGTKVASNQRLDIGIYPEHMVYLESIGLCGQVDKPEVTADSVLNINDYKTNKEIKRKGFTNWEGITKKMLKPLAHLDDCEFNHYSLQLSLYAYIILRHNPHLTLGDLTIEHISFEIDGEDKYGYPITKLDGNKEPIIKGIELIKVPYLRSECLTLVEWLKDPVKRAKLIKP